MQNQMKHLHSREAATGCRTMRDFASSSSRVESALQTPPKFHERTQERVKKVRKFGRSLAWGSGGGGSGGGGSGVGKSEAGGLGEAMKKFKNSKH